MKKIIFCLLLLATTLANAGVVTLSGVAKDVTNTTALANGKLVFNVMNCAFAPLRSDNGATVLKTVNVTLDALGTASGTVVGNDLITCGGTSYYQVTALRSNGQIAWRRNYSLTGTSFNVATAPLLGSTPAPPSLINNPLTTAGDILVGSANGVPARLPIGSNNTCLGVNGGSLAFVPCSIQLGSTSQTGKVAAITSTNLITAAPVGQFVVQYYLDSTVVCTTPGPASTTLTISWTDEVGARTATATLALGATSTAPTQGTVILWNNSTANNISFSTSYTACTTGTGTYSIRLSARQIQ